LKQLIEQYEETGSSIIGVQEVPEDQTSRYGIIDPMSKAGNLYGVHNFVEKPIAGTAPSNLAIMGRYILTPEIFQYLDAQEKGAGGEIQLTDAIQKLNTLQHVFAYNFEGRRYDVGDKLGFITTTLEFALKDKELRKRLLPELERLVEQLKVSI
jgi:UTP--glucose-1-phosphate uridylyltransferase